LLTINDYAEPTNGSYAVGADQFNVRRSESVTEVLTLLAPFFDASVFVALGAIYLFAPLKKIRDDETGRESQKRVNRREVGGAILLMIGIWRMGAAILAHF
jgi:hypothetical protein